MSMCRSRYMEPGTVKQLRVKNQKWLKAFHVFFACIWVGSAVSLTFLNFACKGGTGAGIHGINLSMKFIDDFIIFRS